MLHRLSADQAVHLAGLYAQGQRCLTLRHPDVDTAEGERALLRALDDLEQLEAQQVVRALTTSSTTWWWESTPSRHADDVVQLARTRLTGLLRPGWSLTDQPT